MPPVGTTLSPQQLAGLGQGMPVSQNTTASPQVGKVLSPQDLQNLGTPTIAPQSNIIQQGWDAIQAPFEAAIQGTSNAFGQIGKGLNQINNAGKQNPTDVLAAANQRTQGILNAAGGAIQATPGVSLVNGFLQAFGSIPVAPGETIGSRIMKNGIQPIVDVISHTPHLQDLVSKFPNSPEVVGNVINIALGTLGAEKSGDISDTLQTNHPELNQTFYHGTTPENVAFIQEGGFKPSENAPGQGLVSLTNNPDVALTYGGAKIDTNISTKNATVFNDTNEYNAAVQKAGSEIPAGPNRDALINQQLLGNNDAIIVKNGDGKGSTLVYAKPNVISAVPSNAPADIQGEIDSAKQSVAEAYKKSMPLTPTEQIKESNLLSKKGDNVYTTLAKYNISPASEDAIPQLQSISDKFSEATNLAKQNEYKQFNIDEIKQNAINNIKNTLSSATERKSAINNLNTEIDSLMEETPKSFFKNANGDTTAGSDIVERLRKTGNDWAQYNKLNPDSVRNATGSGLADAVRNQVDKEGTFPAYRAANKEWGNVIHAQQVLEKISQSGKTFRQMGGLSGTIARRILTGVLGYHTGGIGGAIITELGGEYGAKILSNPDLMTYFDRQLITKFGNADATPTEITALKNQVKDFIDAQEKLPKLPAGNQNLVDNPPTTSPIIKQNSKTIISDRVPQDNVKSKGNISKGKK